MNVTLSTLEKIRNIGIIAHIDAGKTTTTERILYYTGVNYKLGEVNNGTTTTDWRIQEIERGITITSASINCCWKRTYNPEVQFQINIIDTPGHVDFMIEVERSLRVLDGAVVILDSANGVEPQTETIWRQADNYKIPRIVFLNKIDKVGADFTMCLESMRKQLNACPIPVQYPYGVENNNHGIIDLITMMAVIFNDSTEGIKFDYVPIPKEYLSICEKLREKLIEVCADYSDDIMMKYLNNQIDDISPNEIYAAIRKGTLTCSIVPVLCGTAFKNRGVQMLLDAIIEYLPAPIDITPAVNGISPKDNKPQYRKASYDDPFCALAFKLESNKHEDLTYFRVYSGRLSVGKTVYNSTRNKRERLNKIFRMHADKKEEVSYCEAGNIYTAVGLCNTKTGDTLCEEKHPIILEHIVFPEPVIQMTIEAKTKVDLDKLTGALTNLSNEDPSFRFWFNEETNQTIIAGMGELHLEIIADRLKRDFNVHVNIGKPQVSYRETITKSGIADGEFVRQIGTRNMYGNVTLKVEPSKGQTSIVNEIPDGKIPKEFISSIEKGVADAITRGVLVGFPIVNIRVRIIDADFNEDSNESAFEIAASIALQNACAKAKLSIMEPTMKVEIITPDEYMGDVISDLNSRRGIINGIVKRYNAQVITCEVPLSTMFNYTTNLRSKTQGRATHTMSFSHYTLVPQNIEKELLHKICGE